MENVYGKIIWVVHCNFPTDDVIRAKYPLPVCEMGDDNAEDAQKTKEAIADIQNMLKQL